MPYYMYVALQEDDKISVLTIDPQTGKLTPQVEVSVPGGPFTLAISPDRKFLYAGCRETPQLFSFQIDQVPRQIRPRVFKHSSPLWCRRLGTQQEVQTGYAYSNPNGPAPPPWPCSPGRHEAIQKFTIACMLDLQRSQTHGLSFPQ